MFLAPTGAHPFVYRRAQSPQEQIFCLIPGFAAGASGVDMVGKGERPSRAEKVHPLENISPARQTSNEVVKEEREQVLRSVA